MGKHSVCDTSVYCVPVHMLLCIRSLCCYFTWYHQVLASDSAFLWPPIYIQR